MVRGAKTLLLMDWFSSFGVVWSWFWSSAMWICDAYVRDLLKDSFAHFKAFLTCSLRLFWIEIGSTPSSQIGRLRVHFGTNFNRGFTFPINIACFSFCDPPCLLLLISARGRTWNQNMTDLSFSELSLRNFIVVLVFHIVIFVGLSPNEDRRTFDDSFYMQW